jgi:hypothetical protein
MEAIKTRLSSLTWAKSCDWKKIRISMDGTNQDQIPMIQFYQNGTSYTHEQGRLQATMQVSVELVLRSTATQEYDQADLMDKMQEIIEAVGLNPNLGIAGVIHARVLSDDLDLHLLEPYFYGTIIFEVIFYVKYNSLCK